MGVAPNISRRHSLVANSIILSLALKIFLALFLNSSEPNMQECSVAISIETGFTPLYFHQLCFSVEVSTAKRIFLDEG